MAIEVGAKLEGKVTGITHFGAFVDLSGGVTGLVHISEIADNYVKDVKDHLKLEDVVTVKVINVDKDGKIGLSIKQAIDRPEGSAPPARAQRRSRPGGGGFNRTGSGPSGGGGGSIVLVEIVDQAAEAEVLIVQAAEAAVVVLSTKLAAVNLLMVNQHSRIKFLVS